MGVQYKEYESLIDLIDDLDRDGVYGVLREKTINRFISMKARYADVPVSGSFELTPLCNFDCKMCYVHLAASQLKSNDRLLSVEEWKQIIKQAYDAGMMYASLTGGECLTYAGFKDIYLYLESLGIHPDVLTNGRLLSEEMIAFFKQHPPGSLQITIYGSNEDAYERVTGHRAYHEVMNGIHRAKKAGLKLFLTVTPNKYIKDDINSLLDLVHTQKLPYAIGDTILPARAETERDINVFSADLETYIELKKAEAAFYSVQRENVQSISLTRYIPKNTHKLNGLPCGGAHSSFHVNWKGELCPCIGFSASIHTPILSKSFKEAWKTIQNTLLMYSPPSECNSCINKEMCTSCPAEKCMSHLGGELNTFVCERFNRYNLESEKSNQIICNFDE